MLIPTRVLHPAVLVAYLLATPVFAESRPRAVPPVGSLTGAAVKKQCADSLAKLKIHVEPHGPLTAAMYQKLVAIAAEVNALPAGELPPDQAATAHNLTTLWSDAVASEAGLTKLLAWLEAGTKRERQAQAQSSLRQIGLAISKYAAAHQNRMPATLDELRGIIQAEALPGLFIDPVSGQRFTYIGQGRTWGDPQEIIIVAYSPTNAGGRTVLTNWGNTQQLSADDFEKALADQQKEAR